MAVSRRLKSAALAMAGTLPAGHGQKSAAIVTIHDADRMTKQGRRKIAAWLRRHAAWLEAHGAQYSTRFTGRYLYS